MKERMKPIDVLTRYEVRALMDQCSRRAPTGLRDATDHAHAVTAGRDAAQVRRSISWRVFDPDGLPP